MKRFLVCILSEHNYFFWCCLKYLLCGNEKVNNVENLRERRESGCAILGGHRQFIFAMFTEACIQRVRLCVHASISMAVAPVFI